MGTAAIEIPLLKVLSVATAASMEAAGLARGDPDAFAAVYERELDFVMRLLAGGFSYGGAGGVSRSMRVRSAFDVEDITQDAFAAFFRQCVNGRFDPSRPVRPYLTRIAINLALKRLGRGSREVPVDTIEAVDAPKVDRLETEEAARLVVDFRGTLPEREQGVFVAYFEEQHGTQAEVGKRLGLSRDQVARAVVSIRQKSIRFFRGKGWLS